MTQSLVTPMITPVITIGITAYNAADTIKEAVQSALLQDWPKIEIIIVDDCSTDDTPFVISELMLICDDIKLIRHPKNVGVAAARNTIITHATGDFIAFFDDDDFSDEKRLKIQYDALAGQDSALALCYTARKQNYYTENGELSHSRIEPTFKGIAHGEAVARRILLGKPFPGCYGSLATCSLMAAKKAFDVLGLFDPALRRGEDTEFAVRAALAGATFIGIEQPLVTQKMTRTADKSLTTERDLFLKIIDTYGDYIGRHGNMDFCKAWIRLKYEYLGGNTVRFLGSLMRLTLRHPIHTFNRVRWALPSFGSNAAYKTLHKGAR